MTINILRNLVRETGPKGERQYLYDAENRQIRVLSGGKEIQEDRYDGEGMRAGLTVNRKKSTFLYGAGDLYAEFDEEGAEQYYLRARYYNPVIGQFMQEDTCQGDGLNLYAYCANDPVMYHDSSITRANWKTVSS